MGAGDPPTFPEVAIGTFCDNATSVGPPDAVFEPDCRKGEPDVESWGVEYTGAAEPGLLDEGKTGGDENAKEGEEEGVEPTPP